jgi:RNA polymerase sigma factor (sigma-70 family)
MNIDSDLLLVEKVKDGDRKAFAELVAIHKRRIFGIILKMVRNLEDVQDLSQETFVRAYKGLKGFKKESSFKTWITKIAINPCINFNRKRNLKSFVCIFDLSQPFMWRSIFKKRIMSKPPLDFAQGSELVELQGFRPTDY